MIPRHRIGSAIVRAAISLLASCLLLPSPADARQAAQATAGRVVATITTLEGSVQMSGVTVELRESGGKLAIAKTLTDGVGQVTFPDVPPGQYVIIASRPARSEAAAGCERSALDEADADAGNSRVIRGSSSHDPSRSVST